MSHTQYYRNISIQNNENFDLVNYQLCIEFYDISLFRKADPNSLIIIDNDEPLPYWVQTWNQLDNKIRIWTKINIDANATKTIQLHYGGYIKESKQNGEQVFELFDDFNTTQLDPNKWIVEGPYNINNSYLMLSPGKNSGCIKSVKKFGKGYYFTSNSYATEQDINLLRLEYIDGASYNKETAYELGNSDATGDEKDHLRLRTWDNGTIYDNICYNQDSILHSSKIYSIARYPNGICHAFQNFRYLGQFTLILQGNMQMQVTAWNSDDDRELYIDYLFAAKLIQNPPTVNVSQETIATKYWVFPPTRKLAGKVCDKYGNTITGKPVEIIVLNKDTKEIENITVSNTTTGTWESHANPGKKLVVFNLEGEYHGDVDIAGAEFQSV